MVRCGVVEVVVSGVTDFAALGGRWRELELRSEGSFFQSWTWVGCLAAERFGDAVLVEAKEAGRTVALGLFNRAGRIVGPPWLCLGRLCLGRLCLGRLCLGRLCLGRLCLGESGSAELDCPYVEQNGFLTAAGREAELNAACLRALVGRHHVVLSGVGEAVADAVRGVGGRVVTVRGQASPFVDLAAVRRGGGDYLAGRRANTRQQLRRSERWFEREGPIRLERAGSVEAGLAMLDEMAALHQAAWRSRGQPGSFARPFFRRFHEALIGSGLPRGEIALLRISAGGRVIGVLYNFVGRGRMLAYQSGFACRDEPPQAKPGLTCHVAAIRHALEQGLAVYDFLAGEDRYKRSLADQSHLQMWLEAGPVWSPRLLGRALVRAVRGRRRGKGEAAAVLP